MHSPRLELLIPAGVALALILATSGTSASTTRGQGGATGAGSEGPLLPPSWHTMQATWAGVDAELLEGRLDELRNSLYSGTTLDAHIAILLGIYMGELDGAAADLDIWLGLEPASKPARFLKACVLAMQDTTSDLIAGEAALRAARDAFGATWTAPFDSSATFNEAWTASRLGDAGPARALAADREGKASAWPPNARGRILQAVAWGVPASSQPWQAAFSAARRSQDRDMQRALARRAPLQLAYLLHSRLESAPREDLVGAIAYVDSVQIELGWTNPTLAYARRHAQELRSLDFEGYLALEDVRRRGAEAIQHFRLGAYEQAVATLGPALQQPISVGYTVDMARQTYLQALVRLERFPEALTMLRAMAKDVRERPDPVTSYYYWDLYIWLGRVSGRSQLVLDGTLGMQRLCEQTGIVMDNLLGGRAELESQLENPLGADRMWQEVYRTARRSQNHDLSLGVLLNLAYLAWDQGNENRVRALLRMFGEGFAEAYGGNTDLSGVQRQQVERSRLLLALIEDRSPSSGFSTASTVADSLEAAGSTPAAVEAHLLIAHDALKRNQPRAALDHCEQAHRMALDKDVRHFTWRALATKARTLHVLGQLEPAALTYAAALSDMQITNSAVSDETTRARRFLSVRAAVDGYVDVLVDLGRTRAAFAADEDDRLRRQLATETPGVDPIRELQATLPSNEALVKFRVQPSGIHAWWVTRNKEEHAWIDLPREDLARLVRAVRRELDGPSRVSPSRVSRTELHEVLLGPFAEHLNSVRTLCFVEDDALVRVPFAMLGQDPLVERHTIVHATSAGARRAELSAPVRNRRRILAVGHNGGPNPPEGLAVLTFAENEARRVGGTTTNLLLGASATVSNIRDRCPQTSILHFACHADFDALGNPFLVLAGEDGLPTKVYDYDMAGWTLPPGALVVLSACETAVEGLADQQPGVATGKLGGFVSSFVDLGAQAVLATLWSVEDSDVFMQAFYKNLSPESSAAEALRRTQLQFLDEERVPPLSKLQLSAYRCYGE